VFIGHVTKTDKGYAVPHFHFGQIWTAQEKTNINNNAETQYPCIIEVRGKPTYEFNCIGFAFDMGKSWINPDQVEKILEDNEFEKKNAPKAGDVIVYKKGGIIQHAGGVLKVDTSGSATQILSKWGAWGLYLHPPNCVPSIYGTDLSFWRPGKCPLKSATLGTIFMPVVSSLRMYRDEAVLPSSFGDTFRTMLSAYYRFAPTVARGIRKSNWAKRIFRYLVAYPFISMLRLLVFFKELTSRSLGVD
jgi:hypothetical protein